MNGPASASNQFIPLDQARWRLTYLWFPAALIPFLIMVFQSAFGTFGADVQSAWSWFLPNVMPTLTLILGVLTSVAFGGEVAREVRRPFFVLSFFLSAVYLSVLTLTLVLHLFARVTPVEFMTMSNFWLSPLQSLAAGAIGVLFTTQREASGSGNAPN